MYRKFGFAINLMFIMVCLSFASGERNQFCTMPDTSLLVSTIFHWCTPDGQNEFKHEWFCSYNKENRIVTGCDNYEDVNWRNTQYDLYFYGNGGRSLDKSTVVNQSTGTDWSISSRVTERRHDDVDTITEDYISTAFRYIYVKNSIGQVVERIFQIGAYNVWSERSRTTFEYDCRGNKIYETVEEPEGNLINRLCYEYNRDNQLVKFKDQVIVNGDWVDQRMEIYKYDSRKRLIVFLNLTRGDDWVLDSAQKREYIYSNHTCNSITRTNDYEYWAESWHLIEQRIDFSNESGLVTETQNYYYLRDSSIIRSKFKYEYDPFRNLILTNHFYEDPSGVWMKDYFETKSYLYVNASDNQNHSCSNKEWNGVSEIEYSYSNPFNFDRQIIILDSKGKICQIKELKLGSIGPDFDSQKEITPEQLFKLRKSKDQKVFWRGNASMLMSVQNSH